MAIAVKRPYACPACRETFAKWGLCQGHVRSSAPCRDTLGDMLRDTDGLQELCRNAAGPGPEASGTAPLTTGGSLGSSAFDAAPAQPNLQSTTSTLQEDVVATHIRSVPPQEVHPAVRKKLDRSWHVALMDDTQRRELDETLGNLSEHPFPVQLAVVGKFLAVELSDFRWVVDKGSWLLLCLRFCMRTNSVEPLAAGDSKPSSALVAALSQQALLPEALTKDCWDVFSNLSLDTQKGVVIATQRSILANISCKYSEHFANIVANENAIFVLEERGRPEVHEQPEQLKWDGALDGTLYQRLLQQMLFKRRHSEERLLKELRDAEPQEPGGPKSLVYMHAATEQQRTQGSAEVLSILHAAAACGLVRICMRFIAEGLDVNERAGNQKFTPLHLAACNGEIETVRLLLHQRADANALDGDGRSALYGAVQAAVSSGATGDQPHPRLVKEVCQLLLMAGAGAQNSVEGALVDGGQDALRLADENGLDDFKKIILLHERLWSLRHKISLNDVAVHELCELQYETAIFVIQIFEKYMVVATDAILTEFRAFVTSDYIQSRNEVQRLGNRLSKRMGLSRKAVDALIDLPPAGGLHALRTWKVEEIIPHVYEVPKHLNAPQPHPEMAHENGVEISTEEQVGDGGGNGKDEADTIDTTANGRDTTKLEGRVRKWDSERGFGFIVQDAQGSEEACKDVFVHRKNIIGSTMANHLDLKDNCRISYRLGEQDGRPRALEATMIDSDGNVLAVHFAADGNDDAAVKEEEELGEDDDGDDCDDEELTRKFLRHLRSSGVQEVVKDKAPEVESFLKCVGLRKLHGRRDDVIWKREIERRIDVFLERSTSPLQKKDFDFRVRRFLHEFCFHSTVARASEALSMLETNTATKKRDDVRSWPAYLATLLRRFDPKLYEVLAERDRRSRVEQKRARTDASEAGDAASLLSGAVGRGLSAVLRAGEGEDYAGSSNRDSRSVSRGSSVGSRSASHLSVASSRGSRSDDASPSRPLPPSSSPPQPPPPPPLPVEERVTPASPAPAAGTTAGNAASRGRGLFSGAAKAAGLCPPPGGGAPRNRTFQ